MPTQRDTHLYAPSQYMLNPGPCRFKFPGELTLANGSVIDDDYVWKGTIPVWEGDQIRPQQSTYVFCWVSPSEKLSVTEVFWEKTPTETTFRWKSFPTPSKRLSS